MSTPQDAAAREHWRQVQAVLDAALDMPPSERAGFVAYSCGTNAALCDEVTELLRACDDSADFLEQPIGHAAGPLIAREVEAMGTIAAGARVGPYRVIRELGRGGNGVVCLAERDDGEYRKRVALKVVLRRPGREQWSLDRFREERQILASLEHPGIARMLDGGMSEGTPWFAMEYVDGLPIDEYCTTHDVTLDARLELFAVVCDVVQYAHQRAIVHRDLKPLNVLVVDGTVKLLDFGIASLTARGESSDRTADATSAQPGLRSLTPGYASPEQVRGEPATAASDVYSLGVLLKHLLAGEHPHELQEIVRTALEAEPGNRYPSAGPMATAVRAYLAERPDAEASGRRGSHSAGYSRRKRVIYAVAVTVALAAVLGGALRTRRPAARSSHGTSAIAVLPFESSIADSTLLRLGRDLAVTLSADLDGIGDIRTVDALTVLSRRPATSSRSTIEADMALARAVGASRLLRGNLTRSAGVVRVDAVLYALDGSVPLARVSATLPAEKVAAATDSLRVGLLQQLWRARAMPPTVLEALSTRSAAALRAYLDGERLVVEHRMREAASAFASAIEADSSFWLAYWRLAWVQEFSGSGVDSSISDAYRAHREELPELDRLMIEARMAPRLRDRIDLARKVTERFFDFWPAWLDFAEVLVHQGPYAGHTLDEAQQPLERAVRLNPRLVGAWDHLMWVALTELDTATTGRVLSALERLRNDSAVIDDDGPRILVYYRYLDRLARTGDVTDTALIDSIATMMVRGDRPEANRLQGGMSRFGFHRARIALAHRTLQLPSLPQTQAAFAWSALATTWASRGAWDSALVAADRASAIEPEPGRVLFAYRLATIGAWLQMVDPSIAGARRIEAKRTFDRLPRGARAELAWVDGLLGAARRDRAAIARARRTLRGVDDAPVPRLDSSLMAFELDVAGRRREAIEVLRALETDRYRPVNARHAYLAGIDRLALSKWLRAAGQSEEAARLLTWHEAVSPFDGQIAHATALLAGPAYFERARLEAARGQPEVARTYYQHFLRRFDMPAPAQEHLVAQARAAIARPNPR